MNGRYKFKGKDGSMGFLKGEVYHLTFKMPNAVEKFKGWRVIVREPRYCPYSNLQSFLKNWNPVE